jgi:hypothetical protein
VAVLPQADAIASQASPDHTANTLINGFPSISLSFLALLQKSDFSSFCSKNLLPTKKKTRL